MEVAVIVSPLLYADITSLCRKSTSNLVAACAVCGSVITNGVHLCEVAYGFYCDDHCPVCSGLVQLTPEEEAALVRNRELARTQVTGAARRGAANISKGAFVRRCDARASLQSASHRRVILDLIPEGCHGISVEKLIAGAPMTRVQALQALGNLVKAKVVRVHGEPR